MSDYTPCYRLELRDWLDTIERKPDAPIGDGQVSGNKAKEKPRPERV